MSDNKKFGFDFDNFPEITQGQLEKYEEELLKYMEDRQKSAAVMVGGVCKAAISAGMIEKFDVS